MSLFFLMDTNRPTSPGHTSETMYQTSLAGFEQFCFILKVMHVVVSNKRLKQTSQIVLN